MSPAAGVRQHTRRTSTGQTIQVRRHTRKTKGPTARRSKRNALRAFKAARRGRKGAAVKLAGLAFLEVGAWAVLQGITLMLATFVLVFVGALVVILGGSPKRRRRRPAARGRR